MKRPEGISCAWLLLLFAAPLAACGMDSGGLPGQNGKPPNASSPPPTSPGTTPTVMPPGGDTITPVIPPITTPPPTSSTPATPPPVSPTPATPPTATPPAITPPATTPPATTPPPAPSGTPVPPASDPPPPPTATPTVDCSLKQPVTFVSQRSSQSADLAFDADGFLVMANGRDVERLASGGNPEMLVRNALTFSHVVDGLGVLPGGDVLVADSQTDSLFRFTPGSNNGGNNNQRRSINVQSPAKFALGPGGALWVTSTDGELFRVDLASGRATSVAKTDGNLRGLTFSPDFKTIYVSDDRAQVLMSGQIQADGTVANFRAFSGRLGQFPDGLATDICGNVYVADRFGGPLVRVTPTGKTEMVSPVNRAPLYGIAFGSGKQGWSDTSLYAVSSDRGDLFEIKLGFKSAPAPR
jgi:hypothetical protein